ncbi:MAG: twin transmembrane helix small protein [Paracoccaceae bacterium]
MGDPLVLLVICASLVVLVILMLGLGSFAKGGEFSRRHSNRLMRWRVGAQAVAVLLIVIVAWIKHRGG